jgi:hypothetical protein
MVSDSERIKILEMIEEGTITAEQGLTLLSALDESSKSEPEDQDELYPDLAIVQEIHDGGFEADAPKEMDLDLDIADDEQPAFTSQEDEIESNIQLNLEDEGSFEETEAFETEAEVLPPEPAPPDAEEIKKWKRWWVIPLWIGAGITVIGGLLMYWAFSANGFGFWFACTWFPFLLGVALLASAWSSRTAPWLHVRVHQAPGKTPQKVAISFPIPIRLTAWGLRAFGHHIPHMEGTNLDEIILALNDVSKDETPLFVDVNEGEDGERVQVFIG